MSGLLKREREIFEHAAEIAAEAERASYLDQACGGDAGLRARLDALLEGHFKGQGFLEQVSTRAAEMAHTIRVSAPDQEEVGTVIGHYKLLEKVGEGGFGAVYVAEQREPVKRRVALKIIKLGMDTRQVIARFEAERQALAVMDHPNIARVLDAGTTETGRPYFVMELVRGMRITDYCDENSLSTGQRLGLFMQVCHAIQHAHQKGIIHRDIKASNVLVTVIDGEAFPKVIDFGIAKATQGQLTDKTVYTQLHQFIGTPAYMSPEQAVLSGVDVDTRSDVYSLGVLLYELLTGHTPFDAKTLQDAGLDEMRRIIREKEPPRPSNRISTLEAAERTAVAKRRQVEPAALSRLVRGDLDWVVMKCLEKDRKRRYDTASALAADIQRHLDDEPIAARPPSKLYRLNKLVQRNKLTFATGAVAVFSLVIGLTVATIQFFRERIARQQADEQAAIAKAVDDFLQKDLLRQADSRVQAQDHFKADANLTVREALERASQRIGDRFRDQPLTELALRLAIGNALRGVGQDEQAVPHLLRAVELSRNRHGAEHLNTLTCMDTLAAAYSDAGHADQALPLLEKTLALRKTKLGPDHPDTLTTMYNLGSAYELAGKLDEGILLLEETVKLRKARLGPDHPDTLEAMALLGDTCYYAGNRARGFLLFEETFERRKVVLGPDHPDTLASVNKMGGVYSECGRPDRALPLYQENLKNELARFGPSHPETLATRHNLGMTYLFLGLPYQALPLLEEVVKTRRVMLGADHPHTLLTMNWLAETYQEIGRLDDALSLAQEAVQLARAKLGTNHYVTPRCISNLACVYEKAGKLDQALLLHEEAARTAQTALGPEHAHTYKFLGNLAYCYVLAGELQKGLPLLEETLQLERVKLRTNHQFTVMTMNNLAMAYHQAGKLEQALPLLEQALKISKAEFSPDYLTTRRALNDLAVVYLEAGKLNEALPLLEDTLESRRAKLGREHPDTLLTLANLSQCLLRQGSYTNAETAARECFELRAKTTPTEWRTFAVQTTLGLALLGQKKYDEAESLLLEGYRGLKERATDLPLGCGSHLKETAQGLVRLYDAQGRPDEAVKWKRELDLLNSPATSPFRSRAENRGG